MLYEPRLIFDLRTALLAGLFEAVVAAAQDFLAEDNKPWTYYLGVAFGGTAAATGGIGFAASLYAVGESVDFLFFQSPEGSSVDLFLDGILYNTIDNYVESVTNWQTVSVIGLTPGILHRIDLVNRVNTNPAKTSPINWLAIGPVTVNGTDSYIRGRTNNMALYNISYSILDGDGDTDTVAIKVIAASHTIAQITEAAQDFALLLDACIEGQITDIAVTLNAALPGGLRATPVANSENQKGATFSFTLDASPYRDSVRIPCFKESLFSGKSVNTGGVVATLVTALTDGIVVTADAGATVEPANRFEFEYASLASAVKSFRK